MYYILYINKQQIYQDGTYRPVVSLHLIHSRTLQTEGSSRYKIGKVEVIYRCFYYEYRVE